MIHKKQTLQQAENYQYIIQQINEDQAHKFARNRWFILGAITALCVFATSDMLGGDIYGTRSSGSSWSWYDCSIVFCILHDI